MALSSLAPRRHNFYVVTSTNSAPLKSTSRSLEPHNGSHSFVFFWTAFVLFHGNNLEGRRSTKDVVVLIFMYV